MNHEELPLGKRISILLVADLVLRLMGTGTVLVYPTLRRTFAVNN